MLLSILNGVRQFEKLGSASTDLSIEKIRMNADGLIKIENGLATVKDYE